MIHRCRLFLLILLGLAMLITPLIASDDQVVAVLSSGSGPYQQAFDGFQQTFGNLVSYTLSVEEPKFPSSTRIIVAIGGKAAHYRYPPGHLLIYCLTPGIKVSPDDYNGRLLIVHTSPSLYLTIAKFKELQPSLKRLAVIWAGDSIQDFIDQKKDIEERLGIEMVSDRVGNSADLPDHLRALKGKVDAIWMPPDAAMVTPANFTTIKEFSFGNGIPFYVPSEGLVEQGGTASVSASFKEIGALAAEMTRQALNGTLKTDRVYPEKLHFAVNLHAAETCHLNIPADVLQKADKVIRSYR
jgi:putative ABC transport system substrate-binding protein